MATKADLELEVLETEAELSKLKKKYKKLQEDYKGLQIAQEKMYKAVDDVQAQNDVLIDFAAVQQDHIQSLFEILETNLERVLDTP